MHLGVTDVLEHSAQHTFLTMMMMKPDWAIGTIRTWHSRHGLCEVGNSTCHRTGRSTVLYCHQCCTDSFSDDIGSTLGL